MDGPHLLHRNLDDIAREYGCEAQVRDLDGPPRNIVILGDAASPPLCDASHSTAFGVFALQVAAAIAFVFVLLVGTLAVTP